MQKINNETFSLTKKYNLNVSCLEFETNDKDFVLSLEEKQIIVEKLLEARELACANLKAKNITNRGFATNVCTFDNFWSIGTNFNNTRNDISSICAERSAIINAYNQAILPMKR